MKSFKAFTPSTAGAPETKKNEGGRKQSTAASSTPKTTRKVEGKLKHTAKEFTPKDLKGANGSAAPQQQTAATVSSAPAQEGGNKDAPKKKFNSRYHKRGKPQAPKEQANSSGPAPESAAPKGNGKPQPKRQAKPAVDAAANASPEGQKSEETKKRRPYHRRKNHRKPAVPTAIPTAEDDDNLSVASTVSTLSTVSTMSTMSSMSTISNSDLPLRERLERDLGRQKYTCAICMDVIRKRQLIWSCRECFVVLHLQCMKQWIFKYLDTVTLESIPKLARDPSSERCGCCDDDRVLGLSPQPGRGVNRDEVPLLSRRAAGEHDPLRVLLRARHDQHGRQGHDGGLHQQPHSSQLRQALRTLARRHLHSPVQLPVPPGSLSTLHGDHRAALPVRQDEVQPGVVIEV